MKQLVIPIGAVVKYRQQVDDRGRTSFEDWPALVYKVYYGELNVVGLSVFVQGVPMRLARVEHSVEPAVGKWSAIDWEEEQTKCQNVQHVAVAE